MMHYNFDNCTRADADEKSNLHGIALCQASIPADAAWAAVLGILKKTKTLDRCPPLKVVHG